MITELKNVLLDDFWIMPQTPKYTESGIPYVTSKNIKNERINFENVNYISIEDYKKISKNRPILKNDILISMIGTLGETAIVDDSYGEFYGQNMFLVRLDNSKIDYRYFINFFKSTSVKNHLARKQNKSTQSYLKANHIESLMIPVLNIDEQKAIAKKLDRVHELINLKKHQIEVLDELIKMFGNVNDNKNNYEIKVLNDVFEFVKDGTHSTPTYTDDSINGIKFLSAKDVTTGTINWNNIKYIPLELHEQLVKRVKPQKNDILLAKNGTTGICAKVDNDEIFDIYVSLALLRPKKEYNVDYLVQAINNDMTKEQFDRSLKGVGVPNLHLGEIQKVKIIVPPIELQNKFAEFVKQIDKQKFEIQKSLEEMRLLQESLMNKYFGEV